MSLFVRSRAMTYVCAMVFLLQPITGNLRRKNSQVTSEQRDTFRVQLRQGGIGFKDPSVGSRNVDLPLATVMQSLEREPSIQGVMEEKSTCTPEYQEIPGHTMCLGSHPGIEARGVDKATADVIEKLHNDFRASVKPPAADMVSMKWDKKLAAVAQKWADQCKMSHDKSAHRVIPEYGLKIGQNVAGGYRTWSQCLKAWYNEVRMFRYGEDPKIYLGYTGWKKIGHYTQIIQNSTSRVGCGYAECRNTQYGYYFVCNYATAQTNLAEPYTEGPRCGACLDTCKDGLCDCGGALCLNGGTLDPETCTCICPPIYKGPVCAELNCPNAEPFYCGRDILKPDCTKYANVPSLCPFMCGICKKQNSVQPSSWNSVMGQLQPFRSDFGCEYSGERSTLEECKAFGDHGNDLSFCASLGGEMDCGDCEQFYNVKKDYCPVMCGLCDAPCNGKRCLNGGHLDTNSCACTCTKPYVGDNCETAECPPADPYNCALYSLNHCRDYVNVPGLCPYLCGIC
ncbi:cysteine-rich venom protein-like [Gigantopelta aegis]|uniref:cysteine-rich venom protein-like n=1 Tax=Gigantopelta aegis TaxID=1735272 RepID=UPI001B88D646|nr:cysteine-rich venom protein-like [Gigantopelta aegis]